MPVLANYEKYGRRASERKLRGVKADVQWSPHLSPKRKAEELRKARMGLNSEIYYNLWDDISQNFNLFHDVVQRVVFQTIKVRTDGHARERGREGARERE